VIKRGHRLNHLVSLHHAKFKNFTDSRWLGFYNAQNHSEGFFQGWPKRFFLVRETVAKTKIKIFFY